MLAKNREHCSCQDTPQRSAYLSQAGNTLEAECPKDLQKILKRLSLPNYSIAEAILPITIHMNEYPFRKGYQRYATHGKSYPPLGPSLWFDAKNDILLFRHAIKNGWVGWSTKGNNVLNPYVNVGDSGVRNLAFEVDYGYSHPPPIIGMDWFWNRLHCKHFSTMVFPVLEAVESISYIMLDWREIVTIALDNRGLLKPGQWSFSLDVKSELFKAEMGKRWSGVTWRVTLGRNGQRSLCEVTQTWKPHGLVWRHYQKEIYGEVFKGVDPWNWFVGVDYWHSVVSPPKEIVEGAVEGTFLGPSFSF